MVNKPTNNSYNIVEICKENEYLIVHIVKKYEKLFYTYEFIDLYQEARMAIMIGMDKYDATKKVKISTFVYQLVEYHMIKLLRMQKAQKRDMKNYMTFEHSLTDNLTFHDIIIDPYSLEEEVKANQLQEKLNELMKQVLSAEEYQIYYDYCYNMSLEELVNKYNVPRRKMQNKISYIRRKLAKNAKKKKI